MCRIGYRRKLEVSRAHLVYEMGQKPEKAQYNIRIDADLLRRYKEFCKENGLDPQGQIINFMRRIVDSRYMFQEKLWEVLTRDVK